MIWKEWELSFLPRLFPFLLPVVLPLVFDSFFLFRGVLRAASGWVILLANAIKIGKARTFWGTTDTVTGRSPSRAMLLSSDYVVSITGLLSICLLANLLTGVSFLFVYAGSFLFFLKFNWCCYKSCPRVDAWSGGIAWSWVRVSYGGSLGSMITTWPTPSPVQPSISHISRCCVLVYCYDASASK